MQEKLERLYKECMQELKSIHIDAENSDLVGEIDIQLAKRNVKRYGCCKQEAPDPAYYHFEKRRGRRRKVYDRYQKHHIEISRWVMDLNEEIIKNTIMHEIIHCFPGCHNHGAAFKKYAGYIEQELGYPIRTVGNKKEDYEKSQLEYTEAVSWKYEISCEKCGQVFHRQRLARNFVKNYRCGKCGGKFTIAMYS